MRLHAVMVLEQNLAKFRESIGLNKDRLHPISLQALAQ